MDANEPLLMGELKEQLTETYNRLLAEGRPPSQDQLAEYYQRFRDEFGPAILEGLDGPALLHKIHDHSDRGSLVYWLEFKNDEELPAIFGSIAGGSALKFGIYRRGETGAWMTGTSRQQQELSEEEATVIARRNRDQLLAGVAVLEQLPEDAFDEQYAELQTAMNEAAPDVSDLAWGHKYFSMLFPDKLDDYHSPEYQRFHLIKLLQMPSDMPGRYASAGRFLAIAREFHWPLNHLTTVLNEAHGSPYQYWRIGSTPHGTDRWDEMRNGSFIAIGWPELPDLTGTQHSREEQHRLRDQISKAHPSRAAVAGNDAGQVVRFCAQISEGDLAVVSTGMKVHGIGRVTGPYQYVADADGFKHQRPVEWLHSLDWQSPVREGLLMAVYRLKKPQNLIEVERRVAGAKPISGEVKTPPGPGRMPQLAGLPGRIQRVLDRKGQVILYGPPGTGKTYWAEIAARELASNHAFGKAFDQLTDQERLEVTGDAGRANGLTRMCCFHPAYGYEDFIEGYRPETVDQRLTFQVRDGIFKTLCEDAAKRSDRRFYLVIDEINRGDIPRIFGELISILEMSKRSTPALLPLTRSALRVPPNVFVVGTMNTADRSIALLDTALRRRFGFIELMPDVSVLGDSTVRGVPLGPWLASLNRRICEHIGRDARNLQVGHSYLMEAGRPIADFAQLKRALHEDILPLLQEYCYEDYESLERVLGRDLVDVVRQRFITELFDAGREDDLVRALLAPDPDIAASAPDEDQADGPADADDADDETEDSEQP